MHRLLPVVFMLGLLLGMVQSLPAASPADLSVYADSTTWENWSWFGQTIVNFNNTTPVQSGTKSIAITFHQANSGFSLRRAMPVNASGYRALSFWVHGGTNPHLLKVYTQASGGGGTSPMINALGNLYVADYKNNRVLAFDTPAAPPDNSMTITVNAAANRKPISPYIYGLNFAKPSFASEISVPVMRWGGNTTSRYNWQNNWMNHANDWFFHNNAYYDPYTGNNQTADQWVMQNKNTGAESLITISMIGYVAKDGNPSTCGFYVKYDPQDVHDTANGYPHCGNGQRGGVSSIIADPLDTSIAVNQSYASGWVDHLKTTFGSATNGGVRFYALDNEPGMWNDTHRDVHHDGMTCDESYNKGSAYAAAIKATDVGALILGPVQDGWTRYWYASYVSQAQADADRTAHGGVPFVPWYLQQMQSYEQANGVRLLDYLDLHFYPQNGVDQSLAGDANNQALRLRSIRALWDPTYMDMKNKALSVMERI